MRSAGVVVSDARRFAVALLSLVRPADNAKAYRSVDAVGEFSVESDLQPAESALLTDLVEWLPGRSMLDIGVGGGRTTVHFAPIVGEYLAIDFSEPLIRACEARFRSSPKELRFATMDVRDLTTLDDDSFDFVLFSYNGLDAVNHEERLQALVAISRVLKPGGYFFFSSHNVRSIAHLYRLNAEQRVNLYTKVRGLMEQIFIRILNPPLPAMEAARRVIIRDGPLEFRVQQYYVTPAEQIAQLQDAGFSCTGMYGLDGRSISLDEADRCDDAWIYYLARLSET
jgi:ubiquinone/menaquinone biosynthesis C-methylase UbiE